MEEREALKRQIELLQNLINNHKNVHGDAPSSSTHQWYPERRVSASGRGQSTSFVHPHGSRGSAYGHQPPGHWRKTYSLSNKTPQSSTGQPLVSTTPSVPLSGTLKEAGTSRTSTLPGHSSKAPGRGQPDGTKIAVVSSGIPPGAREGQKNAITGIGIIAPRSASTGICTKVCKGTPESGHNAIYKGALQKDHQRQTADPLQRAGEKKDRGSVDVTSSVKTNTSGQTPSSTKVELKPHLLRKPTEVKPTVHMTAPDTLPVGKSTPALSALPSAPQQQLSLSPRSKPSTDQLSTSPQKRFTWVRSRPGTGGEESSQARSPLQSPESGLSPAPTSIPNASQASGRSPPTTVGKRTPSKKLPRRLSQATGAPKTSKYTWISSSSTVGSQAKLSRKTPSPRSVALPQRALEKGVSGSKLRNPSPALTPKARKGMGPSSAGGSLSSRYRWKAGGQSTAGTAAGGAAARRGSTFHWTSEKSYKAAKGWLAVPPSLPQRAALQSSSPSSFKLRSRMKIIRRFPSSGSVSERKTTVGSPVGMVSGRHSFRGRAQPLSKSPTGGRPTPSKELVSFGRHKLRRLSPASCRTGPSSPTQRGPAYQRVFRSRYKMVTRQGTAASAHTFHYGPALTWRAKRIQSARSVLQNRLRAPQDRHLSPQRWRGRGIRWIGGSLYRVSANKLSRAASSSPPINRTGKWSSPHQVSPTTSPLGRPSSTRHVASRAVQRSLAIIRHARHKKPQEKQYCMYYNRFGKCNRGTNCPYIHDPDKVAVCTRFLRGTCKQADGTCPFSHKVAKEKMPVCSYFLKGICNNSNCPYSHVYVSRKAAVCQDFIKGYCPQGEKTKDGTQIMQGLTHQSRVKELKSKVEELTGIPCEVQKIMVGYPPSSLDLRNGDAHLKDYPIKSGDTLIVEEENNKPKPRNNSTLTKAPRLDVVPVLARRVVPADNSCLFTSINYVAEGGVYDPACAPQMRGLIARIVSSDPAAYSEAVLGKKNEEYCSWIQRNDTWGGAIEVSILSKFYRCEICVVDSQTVRVDRFGENAGYQKRVLLIYDGIHYDPLQKEMRGSDVPPQTIFSTVDDVILALALELADEAQRKRQFTDVNRFALRCMVCQTGLVGQKEAREHAKETGHTNFGECKKKHTLVCPDFSKTGSCPQGTRCKLQHRQRAKRGASTPGPSATTTNPAKRPRPKEHAKRPRLSVNMPLPEQAQQDAGDSLETPTSGLLKLPSFISLCSSPEEAEVPDTPPAGTPHVKERKLQIKPRL